MIKTIMSAETSMVNLFQNNVASRYSCFELFGFDILLDSKLKPWLIEVNISPSLHSSSSLDLDVKSPLATEVFNMARWVYVVIVNFNWCISIQVSHTQPSESQGPEGHCRENGIRKHFELVFRPKVVHKRDI